ncbi:MAG: hypothetical protein V4582_24980 [Pseudomonadota bacterium]
MKKIGVALLLAGFGWLCFMQLGTALAGGRPGLRVLFKQIDALHVQAIERSAVERIGHEAVMAQAAAVPLFLAPGMLMLVGGLLLLLPVRTRRDSINVT